MSRSPRSGLDDALSAVMADMQVAVDDLQVSLALEREALDQADPTALNHAGDRKRVLLATLEQLEAERLHLASMAGAAPQPPAWQALLAKLQACRETNQRNGQIIGQRLQHVRQALSVLTGQCEESGLYGAAGHLQHAHRSLPLASA
jgi:flagella synthesis protein FlgN